MGSLHGCFRTIFIIKLNEAVALVHGNAENLPILFVHILYGLARHRLRGKVSDKDTSFQHLGVVAARISSVSLENFEHSLTSHLARFGVGLQFGAVRMRIPRVIIIIFAIDTGISMND